MSTKTPPPPENIVISPDGDLTLRLYRSAEDAVEYAKESFIAAGTEGKEERRVAGRIVATMLVSRQVLIDNSPSFAAQFTRWLEATQTVIDMEVDAVRGVEICLRAIHDSLTQEMYAVTTHDLWEAIRYCNYRKLEISKLNTWFMNWIEKKDIKALQQTVPRNIDQMRMLLYPCYIFDHAIGFAFLTKSLVYAVSTHVTELNPTPDRSLHLEPRVIGELLSRPLPRLHGRFGRRRYPWMVLF